MESDNTFKSYEIYSGDALLAFTGSREQSCAVSARIKRKNVEKHEGKDLLNTVRKGSF